MEGPAEVDEPAALAPPRGRPQVFRGWYLVAAGSTIQFLVSALQNQTFGAYAAELTREFGWSRGLLGTGFSIARLESGLLGPAQGWLIDRFGPRTVMRFGLGVFALGLIGFSQLRSLPTFYLFFGLMAVGSSLGGFMSVTVAIVNWFDRFRARALSISQIGFALGGLAAPAVILLITEWGWRETAFTSGILVLVVGLPLTTLMHRRPEDVGLTVDGDPPAVAEARRAADRLAERVNRTTDVDYTAREAMRTRAFWMISLGHGSALFVVSAVMVHLFLHLTDSLGYSDAAAAGFIGLMTVMQMIGQLIGGYLGDRISKRVIVTTCMFMHAAGLMLVAYIGSVPAVIGFAALHGLAWGARGPLMQALRADYFGRTSFGLIMGFSTMIIMVGQMAGPIIAGVLYDRTGSYEAGFTIISAIALLGSVFFVLARRPEPPRRAVAPSALP